MSYDDDPDDFPRRRFNLDDYEPVEDRITKFWAQHPTGRLITKMLPATPGEYIVQAEAYTDDADDRPTATGLAQEKVGSSPVNRTSALENCETSAIGRALANMGYATKGKRPSREEMSKAPMPTTEQLIERIDMCGARVGLPREDITAKWRAKNGGIDVDALTKLSPEALYPLVTSLEAYVDAQVGPIESGGAYS